MYEKLIKTTKSSNNINNLFQEFDKPVNEIKEQNFEKSSINKIIDEAVEDAINNIVTSIFNSKVVLTSSKNVQEIAKICEQFFQDTDFGVFEYMKKTGRSSFKVKHTSGNNGTKFLRKFFEKIFNTCLKNYSYHIISDNTYLCIIFR